LTKDTAIREGLVVGAILLTVGFGMCGYHLAAGRIPVGGGLYALYFGYAFFGIAACHIWFFILNRALRDSRSTHRKRLPKYIEYAYAAVISIGLAQVFISSTRIVDYLLVTVGDEDFIAGQIHSVARGYVVKECLNPGTVQRFTKEYCAKAKQIAEATEPKEFILKEVLEDRNFLNHVVAIIAAGPQGAVSMQSPIKEYADQLNALRGYSARPIPTNLGSAFSWIALLLLPIAIALRLTKTSLELFGGEDLPDPEP
jgi:hypothetical protein